MFATDDINVVTQDSNDKVALARVTVGGAGIDANQNDVNINTARVNSSAPGNDMFNLPSSSRRDVTITTVQIPTWYKFLILSSSSPFTVQFAKPTEIGDDLSIDTGDAGDKGCPEPGECCR
ncbi:MAG: hypothetical protein U0936_13055 [Planctomycetaceae bacterium]